MLDPATLAVLACPHCHGPLALRDHLHCAACDKSFPAQGGVIDLLDDPAKRSALEEADYDARAGYDDRAIQRIGAEWVGLLAEAGRPTAGSTVLEVGAGTGALTAALLRHGDVGRLFATDVSLAFLKVALARGRGDARLSAVRADANRLPFADGQFDLVLGRSILHHLLDYPEVLAQSRRLLRPGGLAVFFEPILEGKIQIAQLAAQVAALARAQGDARLTEAELRRIDQMVRHITKAAWHPQDRAALARLEDKFIFDVAGMRAAGTKAGFAATSFLPPPAADGADLWPQFLATMRLLGIDPARMAGYAGLGEGYRRSVGMFPALRYPPMGYFVFRAS
jgi:ubiquinone/menaquinone biosynthesis C-methylase UbiE